MLKNYVWNSFIEYRLLFLVPFVEYSILLPLQALFTTGISTAEYYPNYAGLATETFSEESGAAGTSLLGAASSGLFGGSNPPNSSLLSDLFVDTKEFDR